MLEWTDGIDDRAGVGRVTVGTGEGQKESGTRLASKHVLTVLWEAAVCSQNHTGFSVDLGQSELGMILAEALHNRGCEQVSELCGDI